MIININICFIYSQKEKSLFYRFFAPSFNTNINSFCATLLPQYHHSLTSFSYCCCCCCFFVAPHSLWQLLCFLWQTATVMATSYQQHSNTAIATTTTISHPQPQSPLPRPRAPSSPHRRGVWARATFAATMLFFFPFLLVL